MGATMLLLYAVRMVQTGIERAYGPSFKRIISGNSSPVHGSLMGIMLAIVLQSSAAVALLAASFAGSGTLSFGAGLAACCWESRLSLLPCDFCEKLWIPSAIVHSCPL